MMIRPGRISIGVPGPAGQPIGPGPGLRRYMGSYKKGGTVKATGLALVHKGEKITPARLASIKQSLKKG